MYTIITFTIFTLAYILILVGIARGWMSPNSTGTAKFSFIHHAALAIPFAFLSPLWLPVALFLSYDDIHQHTYLKRKEGPLHYIYGDKLKYFPPFYQIEGFFDDYVEKHGASPLHIAGEPWYWFKEKVYYWLEPKGGVWNKIAQFIIKL